MTAKLTPMMQQYLEIKRQYPEAVLLFRMGDFYETFGEDARVAARVLNLALTSRDTESGESVPMSGFPHYMLDSYLRKLILAGYRVSVCEQVEDPEQVKGMVKREVVRVVTQRTLFD